MMNIFFGVRMACTIGACIAYLFHIKFNTSLQMLFSVRIFVLQIFVYSSDIEAPNKTMTSTNQQQAEIYEGPAVRAI